MSDLENLESLTTRPVVDDLLMSVAAIVIFFSLITVILTIPALILIIGVFLAIKQNRVALIGVTTRFIQGVMGLVIFVLLSLMALDQIKLNKTNIELARFQASEVADPQYQESRALSPAELRERYGEYEGENIRERRNSRVREQLRLVGIIESAKEERNLKMIPLASSIIAIFLLEFLWLRPATRQFVRIRTSLARLRKTRQAASYKMGGSSVAEELEKWNKLRERGLVTEEEFQLARERLLKHL